MSGVVLRCPSCGNTRATPGECEACHEAQVRYFCTNHSPGRWLDARACPQCGAQFGERARPPVAPRTGVPSRRPEDGGGPWGRREPSAAPDDAPRAPEDTVPRDAPAAGLPELLEAASRARRAHREAMPSPEAMPTRPRLGGCLMPLVLLAGFLLIAFIGTFSVLSGFFFRLLGLYY